MYAKWQPNCERMHYAQDLVSARNSLLIKNIPPCGGGKVKNEHSLNVHVVVKN